MEYIDIYEMFDDLPCMQLMSICLKLTFGANLSCLTVVLDPVTFSHYNRFVCPEILFFSEFSWLGMGNLSSERTASVCMYADMHMYDVYVSIFLFEGILCMCVYTKHLHI